MYLEERCNLEIKNPNHNFIVYFLIKNNEVVYVGKSVNGLARAFSHTDKDFDSVSIMFLPEYKINEKESFYILKYNPIYNIVVNTSDLHHLKNIRNILRKQTGAISDWIKNFINKDLIHLNIIHVKRILSYFKIITYEYKELIYISEESLNHLIELIEKEQKHGNN